MITPNTPPSKRARIISSVIVRECFIRQGMIKADKLQTQSRPIKLWATINCSVHGIIPIQNHEVPAPDHDSNFQTDSPTQKHEPPAPDLRPGLRPPTSVPLQPAVDP